MEGQVELPTLTGSTCSRRVSVMPESQSAGFNDSLQELLGTWRLRVIEQPIGHITLGDNAAVEKAHLVGDVAGERHLVGGEQHCHALVLESADQAEHFG